jgi:hypothetical protein
MFDWFSTFLNCVNCNGLLNKMANSCYLSGDTVTWYTVLQEKFPLLKVAVEWESFLFVFYRLWVQF